MFKSFLFHSFSFSLLISCFVISSGPSFAQVPSEKGRLNDGRAYRTDGDGFKIVDQVAELEVTSDDMRRQIIALEDELEEKNRIIQRLGGGKYLKDSPVQEKDLLSTNSRGLPRARTVMDVRKQEKQCGKIISELNTEVASLRSRLEPASQENPLYAEVQSLQQSKAALESENQTLKQNLASLEKEVYAENEKRISIDSEKEVLSKQLASAQARASELESQLAAVEQKNQVKIAELERVATISQGRAKLAAVAQKTPVERKINSSRGSKEFKGKLRRIQQKILKRKSYLDKLKRSKKGISIAASSLETASGISLDELRIEIAKGGQLSELQIRKALIEIEQILNQDIKTASRLAK
jgi:chromosome segregation ATPase